MDFKDQLKQSVDIVAVIGEHVRLRKSGAYRYMGLCPFHNEKNPSFTVHATHQFYKCFSCGASGDVLKFVMEIEGLSFFEALKSLAERYGIPMPKRSQYADEDSRLRAALQEMHEIAQEHFRANLQGPAGETARNYLARRGLARETIEQFGLGYSDRSGRALLRLFEPRDLPAAQVEQSGLVGRREDGSRYDRFRHRLMFPIHDRSGKIIAFAGRALAEDDNPKYLNSPETPIYKKSHVLYNLHRAREAMRKEDRVILVEGYMDAIGVTAAGFAPVVASCGTALTLDQVRAITQHTNRIFVNFDPDTAGFNASGKSTAFNPVLPSRFDIASASRDTDTKLVLSEGMNIKIVELDGGLDPDEFCRRYGPGAYQQRLDRAKGFWYWIADRTRTKYDIRTSEGRIALLRDLMPSVQLIENRLERVAIANDLASYLGIDPGMVLDSFKKAAAERKEQTFAPPQAVLRPEERILLNALLAGQAETARSMIAELKSVSTVATFSTRRIFQAIFALDDVGGTLDFEAVNARLDEGDQNLLAQAVLSKDGTVSQEEALAAMASIRRSEAGRQRGELKKRIKELERAGSWQEALRLAEELQRLERNDRLRT